MIVERSVQDQRVRAECSREHAGMAENVLDVYERMAASGQELRPGLRVRFGWSLLRLAEDGDALRVTEPDFAAWPEERWEPTLDATLGTLAAQTRLLHELDVDGQDAYFDQAIVAAAGALAQPHIFLRRTAGRSEKDSGWLLAAVQDPEALAAGENLEAVLIANLVTRRPSLLPVLVLPQDFIVIFAGDEVETIYDAAGRVLRGTPG